MPWSALARADALAAYRGHGLSVRVFAIDGMLFYKSTGTSGNAIKLRHVYLPFYGYFSSYVQEDFPHPPDLDLAVYEAHLIKWSEVPRAWSELSRYREIEDGLAERLKREVDRSTRSSTTSSSSATSATAPTSRRCADRCNSRSATMRGRPTPSTADQAGESRRARRRDAAAAGAGERADL